MVPMLFVLMTYNVNYANAEPERSIEAIAAGNADVVLLQEITDAWQARLIARFADRYPYRRFHPARAGGLAVLSKHPIRSDELWSPPEGGFFPAQRLVMASPLGDLQVLHVHLRPNIDRGDWIRGWQTTPPVRRKEIERYFPKLMTGVSTIVAGDFNELPSGLAVEFLASKGLARIPTSGPTTWHHVIDVGGTPISALSLDIDHVIVDASLVSSDARVLDAGASDHRPVVVTLSRRPAPATAR
jgi:endonuclease/exonuclease/phosphatase (EEP) superfamily protein YafD